MQSNRTVYIISDLHLGGIYSENFLDGSEKNLQSLKKHNGFRMCTHAKEVAEFINALAEKPTGETEVELVINGDIIDFLAEEEEKSTWVAFNYNIARAIEKFKAIVNRDIVVFKAMRKLLKRGHRLTLLLGNHDIELSLPDVRRELEKTLEIDGESKFRFIYDGEAYSILDKILIEHGNRYDKWNTLDYNALRQLRSCQSRNQEIQERNKFLPPPGSELVANVMNNIKKDYSFVDLLKPEDKAVYPILLALEPGYKKVLGQLAMYALKTRKFSLEEPDLPKYGRNINNKTEDDYDYGVDISDTNDDDHLCEEKALRIILGEVFSNGEAEAFLESLNYEEEDHYGKNISDVEDWLTSAKSFLDGTIEGAKKYADAMRSSIKKRALSVERKVGVAQLLMRNKKVALEKSLRPLLKSFRILQNDQSFDKKIETYSEYKDAAKNLIEERGYKYVIFGHTHLAKEVEMNGGIYLNSGTWSNFMKLPEDIFSEDEEKALNTLRNFIQDIQSSDLDKWTTFEPNYIRIDIEKDEIKHELCTYQKQSDV